MILGYITRFCSCHSTAPPPLSPSQRTCDKCQNTVPHSNYICREMRIFIVQNYILNIYGSCKLTIEIHGLVIECTFVVCELTCSALLGMDSLSDSTKMPFILNMHEGILLGPHYYRNNGTASLRDNNFHKIKDPQWQKRTTCQYQGLQSFVNNFGILVRRSLVHSAMEDWIVPVLLYNSDPCSNSHDDCHCHPVTIHAQIRITRVEYVQDTWDIQSVTPLQDSPSPSVAPLPSHIQDMVDNAVSLSPEEYLPFINDVAVVIH